jgi:hypothetical protein
MRRKSPRGRSPRWNGTTSIGRVECFRIRCEPVCRCSIISNPVCAGIGEAVLRSACVGLLPGPQFRLPPASLRLLAYSAHNRLPRASQCLQPVELLPHGQPYYLGFGLASAVAFIVRSKKDVAPERLQCIGILANNDRNPDNSFFWVMPSLPQYASITAIL